MCGEEMGESHVEYEKECQKLNKRYRELSRSNGLRTVKVSANSIEFSCT